MKEGFLGQRERTYRWSKSRGEADFFTINVSNEGLAGF